MRSTLLTFVRTKIILDLTMSNNIVEKAHNYLSGDEEFNELYPFSIQVHSRRHWTPIHIIKLACSFLTDPGSKILDIGSGVGKFCLVGAHLYPKSHFTGIEQRNYLVRHAQRAQKTLALQNVDFIQGNFTHLDLGEYDHFYFYNSFFENLDNMDRIDTKVDYSEELYQFYVRHLSKQLSERPSGTRIVTYHSLQEEIPRSYQLVESFEDGDLNFWQKR